MSIEKDNDWGFVGTYNSVLGGTKLNIIRASVVHEKPKRGQQLYQDTGDWTQAPPTLQFLSFIDQADDNYADYRDMNIYGLDDTFSWFIAGAGGSHDVKFGAQYQLGEHYREDQRVTNGRFVFPSDRAYNAADPSTYPERLQIRVPQMVQLLSAARTRPASTSRTSGRSTSGSPSTSGCATTCTSRRSRSSGIPSSPMKTRIRSTRTTFNRGRGSPTARTPPL